MNEKRKFLREETTVQTGYPKHFDQAHPDKSVWQTLLPWLGQFSSQTNGKTPKTTPKVQEQDDPNNIQKIMPGVNLEEKFEGGSNTKLQENSKLNPPS